MSRGQCPAGDRGIGCSKRHLESSYEGGLRMVERPPHSDGSGRRASSSRVPKVAPIGESILAVTRQKFEGSIPNDVVVGTEIPQDLGSD
jgi:hypothetical protein